MNDLTRHHPPAFAALGNYQDAIALVDGRGTSLSFRDLVIAADQRAEGIAPGTLVALEMSNTIESILWYIGLVRKGVATLLCPEGGTAPETSLVQVFRPDAFIRAGSLVPNPHAHAQDSRPHPELAITLSTSGSTGSPKLVKLTRANLEANASSIARYLEITAQRTAITCLPLHYSYGLSILNSHLLSGSKVAVTDLSVLDDGFWTLFAQAGVTDLAGVPYTYELLEKRRFREKLPATLQVMTQAGGRLSADLVSCYAQTTRAQNVRFFVMYGQTEATARMGYLPPELTLENSDCIGRAIPDGAFRILGPNNETVLAPRTAGELVYEGPNVMMGYGLAREDLAKGRELSELKTGDIAEWTESGLVRIVGRASRFSKIAGLRIGLDDVERILRDAGIKSYVTGDDTAVVIALPGEEDTTDVSERIALRCKIPVRFVIAFHIKAVPTLPSGKIDYSTLRKEGLERKKARELQTESGRNPIEALFARSLGRQTISGDVSYQSLGGDSLSYVEVAAGLERLLGTLPKGWEQMPIHVLTSLIPEGAQTDLRPSKVQLEAEIPLRLLALTLIFVGHGAPHNTLVELRGGSNILFLLAGYSAARYQLPQYLRGLHHKIIESTFLRLVIPYLLVITVLAPFWAPDKSFSWWTLSSTFFVEARDRGVLLPFWFFEALIHSVLVTILLYKLPPLRDYTQRHPFRASMILMGIGVAILTLAPLVWNNAYIQPITFDGWIWVYFVGWAAWFARRLNQKLVVLGVALSVSLYQYGFESGRALWMLAAASVVMFLDHFRVSPKLQRSLLWVATSSYFIYLAHPVLLKKARAFFDRESEPVAHTTLVVVGSFALGLVLAEIWRRSVQALTYLWSRWRLRSTSSSA